MAEKISSLSNVPMAKASLKKFPDGENYIRIDSDLSGRDVFLVASMFPDQNSSLMEFLFLADACRDCGAKKITAIIPYFAYGRQDKQFQKGEALSLKTLAGLFKAVGIQKIITLESHFHRKPENFDFFGIPATNISAGKALLEDIRKNICTDYMVIGPDIESGKTVEFATGKKTVFEKVKICPECKKPAIDCKCGGERKRYEVKELKSEADFRGKNVVILDDMIASGSTMIKAAEKVRAQGAKKVICAATHGLFIGNSLKVLQEKSDYLIVTDTIETPVSAISVADLIAEEIKQK
ncbi:MAG: ribose-phosphate diphosphokinase [Nanoarchaeota archaeon]|nr:ribose-phosphate diphosphokinase [Nanoarchaeota archaeon]MBU4452397.1 ribose-phosphate diphosphokinase [Nanoarchaeota archaeon]